MAFALWLAPAWAKPIPQAEVGAAMVRVEAILASIDVEVSGYALGEAPVAELAPADHIYLQGNDGGYVDGRLFINEDSIADCRDLILVHELVHDATVKHRLFAAVANRDVRPLIEALADAVTAAAAEDPYRPGCLQERRTVRVRADLAVLANASR